MITIVGLALLGAAGAFGYREMFGGSVLPTPPPTITTSNEPHKVAPTALCAEIRAANDQLAAAKLVGVFRLQRGERGLSIAFAALRRNLNRITTAYNRRGYCRSAVHCGRCEGGSHTRAVRRSRDVCRTRLASALRRNGNGRRRPPRVRSPRYVRHRLVRYRLDRSRPARPRGAAICAEPISAAQS